MAMKEGDVIPVMLSCGHATQGLVPLIKGKQVIDCAECKKRTVIEISVDNGLVTYFKVRKPY